MNTTRIISHSLFWLIYYSIELVIEVHSNIFTKTSIIRYFLGLSLFYVFLKIFKISRVLNKIYLFSAFFLLFLLMSLCIKYETINFFQNFTNPPLSVQILYIIDNYAHLFFIAFIFDSYYKLGVKHQESIAIENQLYEIETNYLNSKIDSHFFLNSINIFYSHFLRKESEVANKLIRLSNFVKKNL